MFCRLLLVAICMAHSLIGDEPFLDITQFGHEQYQDIIINNEVVKPASGNHRDCELRYQIIKAVLDKYERPFTMLDIGASQGYYTFRTAHDFKQSVCVMLEGNNLAYPKVGDQLLDLCKANTQLDNVILLQKPVSVDDLKRMKECESIDVVLAMNVIHWMGNSWKRAVDHILELAHIAIIETPPAENVCTKKHNIMREEIQAYILSKKAKILAQVPRHTSNVKSNIFIVENKKKRLKRKTWVMPRLESNEEKYLIHSDFKKKTLSKQHTQPVATCRNSDWVPGINYMTFKMCCGAFPTKEQSCINLQGLINTTHNDWCLNNMILQGKKAVLIDFADEGRGRHYSPPLLKQCEDLLNLDSPEQVKKYFWEVMVGAPIPLGVDQ